MPKQFDNPANPGIHERTTGPEIWDDTDGQVDVFVGGVGTGGTHHRRDRATQRHARQEDPDRRGRAHPFAGHQPDIGRPAARAVCPHKIQGIGAGFIPKNLDFSLVDRVEQVTNDESIAMARRLAREEGILCGISCGAAMAAALSLAREPARRARPSS